jgi:hypothetical protein
MENLRTSRTMSGVLSLGVSEFSRWMFHNKNDRAWNQASPFGGGAMGGLRQGAAIMLHLDGDVGKFFKITAEQVEDQQNIKNIESASVRGLAAGAGMMR